MLQIGMAVVNRNFELSFETSGAAPIFINIEARHIHPARRVG